MIDLHLHTVNSDGDFTTEETPVVTNDTETESTENTSVETTAPAIASDAPAASATPDTM